MYEFDIEANEQVLIGSIYEPGVMGIVVDAIGFDSNNGIIYYVGVPSEGPLALYAIPVREEVFSYTKTDLITQNAMNVITGLNYDNVNDKLFATNNTYDEGGVYSGRAVIEIDFTTGEVETLGVLEGFQYFVGASSQFDQATGTYLLVGINTNNETLMIAFNTATNTFETGFVAAVSEIVCNNTLFARSTYLVSSTEDVVSIDANIYPNPASDVLNISYDSSGPVDIQLYNALGALVYNKKIASSNMTAIDLSNWSSGLYTVVLQSDGQTLARTVVVD